MKRLQEIKIRAEAAAPAHYSYLFEEELIRKDVPDLVHSLEKTARALRRLLNKVNVVTAYHRHGSGPTEGQLDELSNRQIEVEEELREVRRLMGEE
jgi:hypothetical protein